MQMRCEMQETSVKLLGGKLLIDKFFRCILEGILLSREYNKGFGVRTLHWGDKRGQIIPFKNFTVSQIYQHKFFLYEIVGHAPHFDSLSEYKSN